MPHRTTRAVYWLIAFLMRKTGPERAPATRCRRVLRPAWNAVRPARLLSWIVQRNASRILPDAAAPNCEAYNSPARVLLANCFGFVLGVLAWTGPGAYRISLCEKAGVTLPDFKRNARRQFRSVGYLARLHMEGGFRRAHLWQLRQRPGATLVALLVRDDGEGYHVMMLANDGVWYHKPGINPAGPGPSPWNYGTAYRLRGLYWFEPAASTGRQQLVLDKLALVGGLYA